MSLKEPMARVWLRRPLLGLSVAMAATASEPATSNGATPESAPLLGARPLPKAASAPKDPPHTSPGSPRSEKSAPSSQNSSQLHFDIGHDIVVGDPKLEHLARLLGVSVGDLFAAYEQRETTPDAKKAEDPEKALPPLAPHDENLVQERARVMTRDVAKDDPATTKICWYLNGAVVQVRCKEQDVRSDGKFVIPNLSSAVDENSLIVQSPDAALLQEYHLVGDDPSAPPPPAKPAESSSLDSIASTKATSSQQPRLPVKALAPTFAPRHLEMDVREATAVSDEEEWSLQYTVGGVSWCAHHIIEVGMDRQHITFVTVFHVENQSGIHFRNARIQFIDRDLPKPEVADMNTVISPFLVYSYPTISNLAPGQKKMIVWNSAKRVTVKNSSGLFVGGDFLKKMDLKAYPRVENWISFKNTKEEGLGKYLPSGQVSIYSTRQGFSSLFGYTSMNAVRNDEEVTIRMPAFAHARRADDDDGSLDATLIQESYRPLTPAIAEAEYRLVIKNSQNVAVSLSVTIDTNKAGMYQVLRSNVTYEKNERGEAFWDLTIPPRGNREIRYKLSIRTRL